MLFSNNYNIVPKLQNKTHHFKYLQYFRKPYRLIDGELKSQN